MVTYCIQEEKLYHKDLGYYTAFAIKAFQNNKLVEFVSDVFLDKEKANSFVRQCNELQVDLVHLYDVIDDIL